VNNQGFVAKPADDRVMALSREVAWRQLCEWTKTESLRKHARAVELVMTAACARHGARGDDPAQWGLAGLLHDADYEQWPEDHPKRIVAWLRERDETSLADAIAAHYTQWGVPASTPLARSLLACDELTGFVVACCMVRPDGIASLASSSVVKRLKDKSFAAKVDRREIQAGCDLLAVQPPDHIGFVIEALKPHADELGLRGRGAG
jgi:predicted hydrolase (HD superfamily)